MTPGRCAAIDEDTGKTCPCRQYREADDAEPPIRCQECLHGRSLHADDTPAPKEESDVTAILRSLTGDKPGIKSYSASIAAAREETNQGLHRAQIAAGSSKSSGSGKGKEKAKLTKEKTFKVSAVVVSPDGLHPKTEGDQTLQSFPT
ncbi:hypothetical protein BV22DRAFT_1133618 [Leucogyrophana mollusca]|uniref:Uncharacterized protein n=1 Tax=Leucogyrophana mollusca TaxID=85980 RepID=A0ACB8B398_9AGAM|nr:hypothetical protein BV22DRAFT_1133618 [Leucogyrophana mollusca]